MGSLKHWARDQRPKEATRRVMRRSNGRIGAPTCGQRALLGALLLALCLQTGPARAQGGGGGLDLGDLNMNNLGLGDLGNLGGGGGGASGGNGEYFSVDFCQFPAILGEKMVKKWRKNENPAENNFEK